jgi:hypothetical protein
MREEMGFDDYEAFNLGTVRVTGAVFQYAYIRGARATGGTRSIKNMCGSQDEY